MMNVVIAMIEKRSQNLSIDGETREFGYATSN